jgi:hypothetical protein
MLRRKRIYIGLGQLDLDNNNVAAAKANFESAKMKCVKGL